MAEPLPPLWSPWSNHLALVLSTLSVTDPETGEVFTPSRVDDAYQLVLEEMRLQEGWAGLPSSLDDRRLREHATTEVLRVLGVDRVEVADLTVRSETRWVVGTGADLRVIDTRFGGNIDARLQERVSIVSDWTDLG